MSRNRFRAIKRNIHCADNKNLNLDDRFSMLSPLFNLLDKNFMQFGVFPYNLSIDEQMLPYFGRHSAKMFIKGKPVRFGFKMWCLAGSTGYFFQFGGFSMGVQSLR